MSVEEGVSKLSLGIAVPRTVSGILQDLKVLPQLRNFHMSLGDMLLSFDSTQVGVLRKDCYNSLQELLLDLKTLQERCTEEWLKNRFPRNMDQSTIKKVLESIPSFQNHYHVKIAELLLQLSEQAKMGLSNGVPFKDMEDAWHAELQDRNYMFLGGNSFCEY
jgi:hypothetical protein